MPAIDVVVFDFGNVLIQWDPRFAFPNRTAEEVDRFFTEFDFVGFNHQQDAGRSFADGLAYVAQTEPQWVPWLQEYLAGYPHTLRGPMPGADEIVAELKRNDVKVYGLTNWWDELYHEAVAATPAIGLLDGVVVSGKEGIAKPDLAIFRLIANRFGFEPAEAVFTDDSATNVAAAQAAGFHGIVFQGVDQLRADLHALGLPISPSPSGLH